MDHMHRFDVVRGIGLFGVLCLASGWLGGVRPGLAGQRADHGNVAQQRVVVNGVTFDSLRMQPLAGALVSLRGSGTSAFSDSLGKFHLDGVAPGKYVVEMQHDVLDSLGLSGITVRANITDGRDTLRVNAPSFAALWAGACGDSKAPTDSGFIYGTVRNARDEKPVNNALVELRWLDIDASGKRAVSQKRWRNAANTDSTGSFALCGVPTGTGLRITAITDSLASGAIDLPPRAIRVQRRDLLIGEMPTSAKVAYGTIAGFVRDAGGRVVPNARIAMDEVPEVLTGIDGAFIITQVPVGTRQLRITAIGALPGSEVVSVSARDTSRIEIKLSKITALAEVVVKASAAREAIVRGFEDRRRQGLGYFKDSTQITRIGLLQGVFASFPSVYVQSVRGGFDILLKAGVNPDGTPKFCSATLWIDGRFGDMSELRDLASSDIAALEVYPRGLNVPADFIRNKSECGTVVVWTKWKFP